MGYASASGVRLIGGFTTAEIDDKDLGYLCSYADKQVLRELTIYHENEDLEPNLKGEYIDGQNKVFYVKEPPIADLDFDMNVTTGDVKVFIWTDQHDEASKSLAAVSGVNAYSGRIELVSAPSKDIQKITCDYRSYLAHFELRDLEYVANLLAAYLAQMKIVGRLPTRVFLGRELRVTHKDAGSMFFEQYRKALNELKTRDSILGRAEDERDVCRAT